MSAELVHVALGGTISMRIVDGLAVPELSAAELAGLAGIKTTAVDIATVGGPQLTFGYLVRAADVITEAQARGAAGVIVTLGTDAIEEVAAFFACTGPRSCNLVITGSMDPGAEPGSDGPGNLRDAASIAGGPLLPEPVVVFAGGVSLARAVIKVSGLQVDAFASDTERSWTVAEVLRSGALPGASAPPAPLGAPGQHTCEVPIVMSALSVGQDAGPITLGAEMPPAIVCVASGAGNLTPEAATAATEALAAGSVVAIATRALDRRLSPGYGYPGGSGTLAAAGAVLAEGMSPHRLRMFLLVALSRGLRGQALKDALLATVDA